jgi:integrase/recombinase XerD
MARRGRKAGPERFAGDITVAGGWRSYLVDFVQWMRTLHYSEHTVRHRRIDLGYFVTWCEERSIRTPQEVTRAMLERYRGHVFGLRKADGNPLAFGNQFKRLMALRVFFKWMTRSHHLLFNPAAELELPKVQKRLPRHVLSVAEVEQVLNQAEVADPLGLRDRAILETLYSTGIRRQELLSLVLSDLDLERGTLMIRQGKGGKDRMVPIGSRACAWLDKYLREVRPSLAAEPDDGTLFLSVSNEKLSANRLSELVKGYLDAAGLPRAGSCHLLRHACATHMLENGADIRYIQALLGHESLSSTEVYTRVTIVKLKEVHEHTHPARLKPAGAAQAIASTSTPADPHRALRQALAAEADEDEHPSHL